MCLAHQCDSNAVHPLPLNLNFTFWVLSKVTSEVKDCFIFTNALQTTDDIGACEDYNLSPHPLYLEQLSFCGACIGRLHLLGPLMRQNLQLDAYFYLSLE